ncbi:unnamed protein product [Lampetra planeri]
MNGPCLRCETLHHPTQAKGVTSVRQAEGCRLRLLRASSSTISVSSLISLNVQLQLLDVPLQLPILISSSLAPSAFPASPPPSVSLRVFPDLTKPYGVGTAAAASFAARLRRLAACIRQATLVIAAGV